MNFFESVGRGHITKEQQMLFSVNYSVCSAKAKNMMHSRKFAVPGGDYLHNENIVQEM